MLGAHIKALRKAKKLTQTQLAKKIGISQSELSRMETNSTEITVSELSKLAVALDTTIADLLDESKEGEGAE